MKTRGLAVVARLQAALLRTLIVVLQRGVDAACAEILH
jgi:hypothetical protein